MKFVLPRKVLQFMFLLALYVSIFGSIFLYKQIQTLSEAHAEVSRTYQTLEKMNVILISLEEAKRGAQGYLNTGKDSYFQLYKTNIFPAISETKELSKLIVTSQKQAAIMLMEPHLVYLLSHLDNLYNNNYTSVELLENTDKAINQASQLKQEIVKSLDKSNSEVWNYTRLVNLLMISVSSLINLFLLLSFFMLAHQESKFLEEQLKINKELAEKNIRIEKANRLKSEFLANMSHELRTPLNAIIGFSELISNEEIGPINEEQKTYMKNVLLSGKDLLRLINDVLDLSKIESGKMDFHPEKTHLPTLVNEVIGTLKALTNKKNIHLSTSINESVHTVYIDPSRFKQVLYNYLSNALKFTPELGSVSITITTDSPDTLVLEVADNGIGIKPEEISSLFIEFQQLDSSKSKKYQGTGLGLALTKHIVEAQGGKVGVKSVPAKGSIFYAILPKVAPDAEV